MDNSIGLRFVIFLVVSLAVVAQADDNDGGQHWAVLVAGSNYWLNYRHQADICHAYHIISRNGIPDERIIVMMYDDIAHNPKNPFPGFIKNSPNGQNVYPGVPKDYTGEDVRPDVFLKVLTGDADGVKQILGREGKVLKSGPKDRVFINFADHGAPGVLAFPSHMLYWDQFVETVTTMHKLKMYKQLVFYVEACESGSMFHNFTALPDINVFATTASNKDQSSYSCYFDNKLHTALGDVYSVSWMEDSDRENLSQETLDQQFRIVRSETNHSTPTEYGDMSIKNSPVADFQGTQNLNSLKFMPSKRGPHPMSDAVPSEDVHQEILLRKISTSGGEEKEKHIAELQQLWQRKKDTETFFKQILAGVADVTMFDHFVKMPLEFSADFSCYKESVRLIMDLCPGLKLTQNDFALRKLRVLFNLCETDFPAQKIWSSIGHVTSQNTICA